MFNPFASLFKKQDSFDLNSYIDELEEALITADAGHETANYLLNNIKKKKPKSLEEFKKIFRTEISAFFQELPSIPNFEVIDGVKAIVMLGVNGTGKTTSLAKLAHMWNMKKRKVIVAAGDTFRAAAIEQVEEWCKRINVPLVKQKHLSDSSSVIFDALTSAISQKVDFVFMDTAGRMHTNDDLMREIDKINRTVLKKIPESNIFRLMVIDSQTGQNSFTQVQKFKSLFPINGIVITKLDSGFKAGILLRIVRELQIPIWYSASGESIEDIEVFSSEKYIDSLFQ